MSTRGTSQAEPEEIRMVKNILIDLVDAVVYSERALDIRSEIEKLKREIADKIRKVNEVDLNVSYILQKYEAEETIKVFSDTRKQITDFATLAFDQYKNKLEKELRLTIREKEEELITDETRAIRSLEAYLAKNPLPLEELGISVKETIGGYEGHAIYRCGQGIKYEFILNTRNVERFRKFLEFKAFAKGVHIPVRMGSSWITKDPAIDFEKMGKYYMTSCEFSKEHLISTFINPEKESEFKFIYSRSEESSFVHTEYRNQAERVDITSQPALNRNLNTETLKKSFEKLAKDLNDLEEDKLKLTKLSLYEVDMFSEMGLFDFLLQAIKLLNPGVRNAFAKIIAEGERKISENRNGENDELYIEARLRLLKDKAPEVAKLLGIEYLLGNENAEPFPQ